MDEVQAPLLVGQSQHRSWRSRANSAPAAASSPGRQALAVIGKLLGHKDVRTTARYAHLADDPVRQAADRIAKAAAAGLSGQAAEVINIRAKRQSRKK